ncbi:MAG: DNA sulfur modification protein DndD, partial [Woeseia sp.]
LLNDESGVKVSYRIVRSWTFRTRAVSESLDIYVNGLFDATLSEIWDEEVERLIPRNLAHLFFFDGERIETLADPTKSADILRIGIHSLLGIELVDQLQSDLTVYRRRLKKGSASPVDQKMISKLEADLEARIREKRELTSQLAELNNEVSAAEGSLRRANDQFERQGGVAFEKHKELEHEKAEVSAKLSEVDQTLREMAAGVLPLAVVRPLLQRLEGIIQKESDIKEARLLAERLKDRDEKLLNWIKKAQPVDDKLFHSLEHYLSDDREQYSSRGTSNGAVNVGDAGFLQLRSLLNGRFEEEQQKLSDLLLRRRELAKRSDYVDRALGLVPEESVIARYMQAKAAAQAEFDSVVRQKRRIEEQLASARAAASEIAKRLDRELAHIKQSELGELESDRLASYSKVIQNTLRELRQRTLVTHLASLESYISSAFKRLLRKDSLVEKVTINPETFAVELVGANGPSIAPQLISAGERQILAIALLWGLGKAAGRKMPIVIDTPLGRLDSHHRKQLVEQYFPEASHQVILLSTDEEIDEALYAELDDSLAHTYTLDYNDRSSSTAIMPGYFWQ